MAVVDTRRINMEGMIAAQSSTQLAVTFILDGDIMISELHCISIRVGGDLEVKILCRCLGSTATSVDLVNK